MAYNDRIPLIEDMQSQRNSILLTYITSTRGNLEAQISMDSIGRMYTLLQQISTAKEDTVIDLFIHSNGGDGIVPWKLVTLIREHCREFNVIVPYRAFSAATLTALGADNIYMHPMGMLGPTDPKVFNEYNPSDDNGQKIGISVEDVFSYISLVKEDVGITHEDELIKAWDFLAGDNRVHPLALGNVKRFYSQSRMMAKKLLSLHMDSSKDHEVREIADNLNSKLYFHGHPINYNEAKELGLKVSQLSTSLQEAVWRLYLDYETELKLENTFKPDMELKAQHPSYPLLNPNQPASSAHIGLEETMVCIESIKKSHQLTVGFTVEGYKSIMSNGTIQEFTNLQQTKEEWVVTEAPAT